MPEHQAGLDQTAPFVALEGERRIERFAGATGQPPPAAERDGLRAGTPRDRGEERVTALSDRARILETGAR